MPQPAPLTLTLYNQNNEPIKTFTRTFVPWKMLKKAVGLYKQFGSKSPEQFEETDIDALAAYVIDVFDGQGLTIKLLDDHSDIGEMTTVIKSVVSRAKGIMDPTLPPKA